MMLLCMLRRETEICCWIKQIWWDLKQQKVFGLGLRCLIHGSFILHFERCWLQCTCLQRYLPVVHVLRSRSPYFLQCVVVVGPVTATPLENVSGIGVYSVSWQTDQVCQFCLLEIGRITCLYWCTNDASVDIMERLIHYMSADIACLQE